MQDKQEGEQQVFVRDDLDKGSTVQKATLGMIKTMQESITSTQSVEMLRKQPVSRNGNEVRRDMILCDNPQNQENGCTSYRKTTLK